MATLEFTYDDYEAMQARLDPELDELRHKNSSHLWPRLKEGWEFTEQWLGSRNEWPEIMTGDSLNKINQRSESYPPSRKILYVTKEGFDVLTQEDLDRWPFIVIKVGYKNKMGHHLETLQKKFAQTPKARVDVQSYTTTIIGGSESPVYDGGTAKQSASRLKDMLAARESEDPKPLMRDHVHGRPWKKSLPWNWLSLNGDLFDDIDAPTDAHESLQLLHKTISNLQPWRSTRVLGLPRKSGYTAGIRRS
ncbi:hypothetical protein FKW77_004753 [Venturia effusa]|uniref:Uncharacterized protein n=1 Tax=Venturia effusa TaxID=50376 RepID=A0A517LQ20_9PEZI|nr:hypothetical protein FKW77_004753 [Venturia effusa]